MFGALGFGRCCHDFGRSSQWPAGAGDIVPAMRTLACSSSPRSRSRSAACAAPASEGPRPPLSDAIVTPSQPFYGDPANHAVYALDISLWEGPISQYEMDCFWDSGVRHVVVGTQLQEIDHPAARDGRRRAA